jgi:Flp pilus assembly pilin Flp
MGTYVSDERGATSLEYAIVACLAALIVVGLLSVGMFNGYGVVIEFRIDQNGVTLRWPSSDSEQAGDATHSVR